MRLFNIIFAALLLLGTGAQASSITKANINDPNCDCLSTMQFQVFANNVLFDDTDSEDYIFKKQCIKKEHKQFFYTVKNLYLATESIPIIFHVTLNYPLIDLPPPASN